MAVRPTAFPATEEMNTPSWKQLAVEASPDKPVDSPAGPHPFGIADPANNHSYFAPVAGLAHQHMFWRHSRICA